MSWNKGKLFFLLLIHLAYTAESQDEKVSLRQILTRVENQFSITFTYVDENIKGISITDPSPQLALVQTLEFLQLQTGLTFEQINERFVAIRKQPARRFDICGILLDSETGEKIAGASVQYVGTFTYTDESGYFKLTGVAENSSVSILSLGHKPVNIPIEKLVALPCLSIPLETQSITLEEISISDYITEGISKKVDGSFQINRINLGILPGLIEPDVLQTLQALPGIQSVDETISNLTVRGGTNDQNLVLWDGIKMYQTGHFFGLISAFNPYLTDKILFIKNGTSTSLNDGVSSTIDIRSDDNVVKKFSGGAGINMINGDFFVKIPLSSKMSMQVSGRRSIADLFKTPTYNEYFERTFSNTDVVGTTSANDTLLTTDEDFNFYDLNLKLMVDLSENDKLRVNFLGVRNEISYQENATRNNVTESKTSNLSQQSTATGLSYHHLWSNHVKTIVEGYYSDYKLESTNYDIFNNQRLVQKNKVSDMGLKAGMFLQLNQHADLAGGYQFYEVAVTSEDDINNPPFSRLIKRVLRTHAAFLEANYSSPSNFTNLRAGLRVNYISEFDKFIIEPRLSLNQKLGEHLSVEILGEMKSQTSTQIIDFQSDFLGVEKRRWVLADDDNYPVVTSKQLSTGFQFNKENVLITLEGYLKEVKGITTSSQGFLNQFQFVRSAGSYTALGFDLLINKKFNKISSWVTYSYADNTYTFNDLVPSSFPNNLDIRHTIALASSFTHERFEVSAGLKWHTGKPFTKPVETDPITGSTINYEVPNSSRLEDYARVDLSVKYKFPLSARINAQIGASIWNLLDNTNIIDQSYRINDTSEVQVFQQKALGITPNVMFRIEF